jgi:hypothetical protein
MVTKVKTGIVFEGGAFRTIFSCGVMDALVENDIMPDYMIGVSAGAAYGVSMASKQPRRNLDVLMKYRNDKRYLGLSNMIDKVYSAELLIDLYDYNGSLKHGFINSILSQRDCLKTTDGYNYIALEDDVWVYTGITSVGQDNSNVGFVLMNQRTMETRYYEVSGAEEYSAMDSAKGRVQNLFSVKPLLVNCKLSCLFFKYSPLLIK